MVRFDVASTDGVVVAATDHGGQGPPLVFCHATGFCGGVWEPMIDVLTERFRCFSLDFRSHGRTALPDGVEPVWTGFADDLLAVVAAVRDEVGSGVPIGAVGHSMGGTAIILAEVRHPGTFSRAWTFEPILLPHAPVLRGDEGPEIAQAARRRRSAFDSRQAALERYRSRPPLGLLDEGVLTAYVTHGFVDRDDGTVELACSPAQEAAVFEHHNTGARELVADVRIPFMMGASGDGGEPGARVVSAAADHPHLSLVSYPDLTHFGPLQEPNRLAVDVARFFAGESGGNI